MPLYTGDQRGGGNTGKNHKHSIHDALLDDSAKVGRPACRLRSLYCSIYHKVFTSQVLFFTKYERLCRGATYATIYA